MLSHRLPPTACKFPPLSSRQPVIRPAAEGGFAMLEAVIAVVIFTIGVMGLMGLQARSIQADTEARSRAEATMVANQVVGDIWSSVAGNGSSAVSLSTTYGNCASPSVYSSTENTSHPWAVKVVSLFPNGQVSVCVPDSTSSPNEIRVTVQWTPPNAGTTRSVQFSTLISVNNV